MIPEFPSANCLFQGRQRKVMPQRFVKPPPVRQEVKCVVGPELKELPGILVPVERERA